MAGQQALLNFLNNPAMATLPLDPDAKVRAQLRAQAGRQGAAVQRQNQAQQRAQLAQQRGNLAQQRQQLAAQKQQAQNLNAQQRVQLQAQRQAQQGQKQAVDALQRQQRIGQGGIRLQQSRERLELGKLQEERLQTNNLANAVEGLTGKAKETGSRLESWAANVRTPGGIGLLLIVIFIFLWAIVPVNGGKTRGQLFWLTLTGRTKMADTPDAGGTYTDPGATGASGNFGSGQAPAASNGHSPTFSDLLTQAHIRDFGASGV